MHLPDVEVEYNRPDADYTPNEPLPEFGPVLRELVHSSRAMERIRSGGQDSSYRS